MNIVWYGQSCFKITFQGDKKSKQWTTVLIDPFSDTVGLKMPKVEADIVLLTNNHEGHNKDCFKKESFIIDSPGEYEVQNMFIKGISSFHDDNDGSSQRTNTMYTIFAEDINICHMGDFGEKELKGKQIEEVGDVDLLFVPIGGDHTINAKEAAKVISQIEPRIVVPMQYNIPGLKIKLDDLSEFLKAIGEKGAKQEEKLNLQKKDLPTEEMRIIPLVPQAKKA